MRNIHAYSLKADGERFLAKNFQVKEFRCRDGSDTVFVAELLPIVLQALRGVTGRAVSINSGYRTASHNNTVGGAAGSQHLRGMAADISVKGMAPRDVAKILRQIMPDWGGVGIYARQGFVHVDVREQRVDWAEA